MQPALNSGNVRPMKTNQILTVVTFGLMISVPAFADWSMPVTYSEVLFGCNGTTPDLSVPLALNIGAGNHGEIRAPDGAFQLINQNQIQLSSEPSFLTFGTLAAKPTCTVEDDGEGAHPSWNAIQLTAGSSVVLTFTADLSSCEADAINDGFTRTNHYTLSILNNGTGLANAYHWTDVGHYASPVACQTLNDN